MIDVCMFRGIHLDKRANRPFIFLHYCDDSTIMNKSVKKVSSEICIREVREWNQSVESIR